MNLDFWVILSFMLSKISRMFFREPKIKISLYIFLHSFTYWYVCHFRSRRSKYSLHWWVWSRKDRKHQKSDPVPGPCSSLKTQVNLTRPNDGKTTPLIVLIITLCHSSLLEDHLLCTVAALICTLMHFALSTKYLFARVHIGISAGISK